MCLQRHRAPPTERLKQQESIVSQFYQLEVQGQDVGRAMLEKNVFQASLPASHRPLACSKITPVFTWCSLGCMPPYVPISPFCKDTSHIVSGVTPLQDDLILADDIFSDPHSQIWSHSEVWGLGLQMNSGSGGTHFNSYHIVNGKLILPSQHVL